MILVYFKSNIFIQKLSKYESLIYLYSFVYTMVIKNSSIQNFWAVNLVIIVNKIAINKYILWCHMFLKNMSTTYLWSKDYEHVPTNGLSHRWIIAGWSLGHRESPKASDRWNIILEAISRRHLLEIFHKSYPDNINCAYIDSLLIHYMK